MNTKNKINPTILLPAILLAGLIGIYLIGIFSPNTIHPDEYQTEPAIMYYANHNALTDVRDLDHSYFSGYGMTRLWELNIYYFLAGKLAMLLPVVWNFRGFSLLLATILTVMGIGMYKENPLLTVAFCITPQLWYLFSYATSDAFDFFLGYLCLYQILKKNSFLHKILEQNGRWYHYIPLGILFGLTLMSKKNYYLIPLWLFFFFLYEVIFAPKEKRKHLILSCITLFCIALLTLGIRMALDFSVYGLDKSNIIEEVTLMQADYEYKSTTPLADMAPSIYLHQKGISLSTLLTQMGFHTLLGESFCGLYGAYAIGTPPVYYITYGLCFFALFVFGSYGVLKTNFREKNAKNILSYITCVGLMLLSYLLVIYNAYFIDFQPQGRYLFPALLVFVYLLSLDETLPKRKSFQILVTFLALLSLASFYLIGIRGMI